MGDSSKTVAAGRPVRTWNDETMFASAASGQQQRLGEQPGTNRVAEQQKQRDGA